MKSLSFNTKRTIVGGALTFTLVCLANYWFGFNLFGSFDRKILVVSFAILGVVVLYVGPTVAEIREYRAKK